MSGGSFEVFQHCKSGEFLILRFFIDRGIHFANGDFIVFTPEQMKLEGVRFAEEHFKTFATRKPSEPTQFQKMTVKEREKFRRNHIQVAVSHTEPDKVEFTPMRLVMRKGLVVRIPRYEYIVCLPWPTTAEKFYEALLATFENAC